MAQNQDGSETENKFTFISVWAALIALTAATVTIARLKIGAASMLLPLVIASAKALLVFWFFMHLRREGKVIRIGLVAALGTLTIFIMFMFLDVAFR